MVFAEDAEDATLDGHLRGRDVDGFHLDIGWLQANDIALDEEALEGRL